MKYPIRAKVPTDFNQDIHKVITFKRRNYENLYTLDDDGYYTYKGISAEASIHYHEDALLGMDVIEVVEFINK